jgi:aspartyl protease family protein
VNSLFSFSAGGLLTLLLTNMIAAPAPELPGIAYTAKFQDKDSAHRSSADRGDDGLFYITVRMNDKPATMLVDTGASHLVLSKKDAKRFSAVKLPEGKMTYMSTAAGSVAVDWVLIDRLEVQGQLLRNVRAAVPRKDIGVSLLGQNALAQFRGIHIDGDRLTLLP